MQFETTSNQHTQVCISTMSLCGQFDNFSSLNRHPEHGATVCASAPATSRSAEEPNKKSLQAVFYQWHIKLRSVRQGTQTRKCKSKLNTAFERGFRNLTVAVQKKACKTKWNSTNIITGEALPEGTEMKLRRNVSVLGRSIVLPKTWDPVQSHTSQLFELCKDSEEFSVIAATMEETLPNITIKSIQRAQGLFPYQRYYTRKTKIQSEVEDIKEKLLFHGTRGLDPIEILSHQGGFDHRLAGENNLWGPAVYFAEDARFADIYAHHTVNFDKQLLLASVILGDVFDFGTNTCSALQQPPMNIKTQRRCDSISGITKDSRVYGVFDSAQCCPRYLITYSDTNKEQEEEM